METFTAAMQAALSEGGVLREGAMWRLDRTVLPLVIYEDKNPHGPYFGVGIHVGGPGKRLAREDGGVVTVSQCTSAGGRDFFYDFSKPDAQHLCEQDFFAATLPLIGLADPTQLGQALLRGDYLTVHYGSRPWGGVFAALAIGDAYGLESLMPEIAQRLHDVTRDPAAYEEIHTVARDWPDRVPGLGSMIATIPPPPSQPPRARGWSDRLRRQR
ncbi:hypothetical protein [Blastococcus haudaquaticus]|uniref:hypothetical protein n=1 Tax=Blastococcus haudaquaticus TaxID=1938745 RepID=UPI0011784FBD|nr:hypothetical protein [Blastococcus haudaquaticus]